MKMGGFIEIKLRRLPHKKKEPIFLFDEEVIRQPSDSPLSEELHATAMPTPLRYLYIKVVNILANYSNVSHLRLKLFEVFLPNRGNW